MAPEPQRPTDPPHPAPANGEAAPRVLLVEDDEALAELVSDFLVEQGFDVRIEARGDAVDAALDTFEPALVVLDIMLPGKDGLTVCQEIRDRFTGGIMMLTARGDEVDEIRGLEVGADDYLAKPVRPSLLLARLRSLLRRVSVRRAVDLTHAGAPPMVIGGLEVNPASRVAKLAGRALDLTTMEFDLLALLARATGVPVSRDEVSEKVRGVPWNGFDRAVDILVSRVRGKLGDPATHQVSIVAVRGVGYQLTVRP